MIYNYREKNVPVCEEVFTLTCNLFNEIRYKVATFSRLRCKLVTHMVVAAILCYVVIIIILCRCTCILEFDIL